MIARRHLAICKRQGMDESRSIRALRTTAEDEWLYARRNRELNLSARPHWSIYHKIWAVKAGFSFSLATTLPACIRATPLRPAARLERHGVGAFRTASRHSSTSLFLLSTRPRGPTAHAGRASLESFLTPRPLASRARSPGFGQRHLPALLRPPHVETGAAPPHDKAPAGSRGIRSHRFGQPSSRRRSRRVSSTNALSAVPADRRQSTTLRKNGRRDRELQCRSSYPGRLDGRHDRHRRPSAHPDHGSAARPI